MTAFWVEHLGDVHRQPPPVDRPRRLPARGPGPADLAGRVMLCRAGRDAARRVHRPRPPHRLGVEGVQGLGHDARHGAARRAAQESAELPEPVFTPSTKAEVGLHDENITYDARRRHDRRRAGRPGPRREPRAVPPGRRPGRPSAGIVIADTKFELGLVDGELILCDEVLTPDSSRFWPADAVVLGATPPSFDKQPVRDYLDALDWDKTPPPPPLPAEVVAATSARYVEAYERITGRSFADWPGVGVAFERRCATRCRSRSSTRKAWPTRRAPPSSGPCPRLGFAGISGVTRRQEHPLHDRGRLPRPPPGPRSTTWSPGSSPTRSSRTADGPHRGARRLMTHRGRRRRVPRLELRARRGRGRPATSAATPSCSGTATPPRRRRRRGPPRRLRPRRLPPLRRHRPLLAR